jgi:dTDP-glucose 4,6-dehydratase
MSINPQLALVTGGAGFIGCNLIRHLVRHTGLRIVNIDKVTYAGNLESLSDLATEPRYNFEPIDLVDNHATREAILRWAPDLVLHLAAETHVDRSIDRPGPFVDANIVGTFNLLESIRDYLDQVSFEKRATFRFVHVSTDEVFGSLAADDPGSTESSRYDPSSPYAASKAASDHLARSWHRTYRLPVIVTHSSNNYGPFQFPEKLIPIAILKAIAGQPIPVYGRGENVRDWLYVEDHVAALLKVATNGRIGHTYNIGGSCAQRNIDVVTCVCHTLDELLPARQNPQLNPKRQIKSYEELIEFVPDRPGHDLRYAMRPEKIRNKLGWQPAESLTSGLRKTVAWYLDNRPWWQRILSGAYHMERLGLGG